MSSRFDWRLALALGVALFSWALAWVSIRAAVVHFSPGQLALGRYLIAAVVLLPFWAWHKPQFERREWPLILVAGVTGFTLYNLGINAGEQTITAGAAALIGSTIPILSTLGAHFFLRENVSRATWWGGALAFAGVFLIAWGEKEGLGFSVGAFLVLGAALCAAVYGNVQKVLLRRHAALPVTSAAILVGVLTLVPFGGGLIEAVHTAPPILLFHLVLLGVFPGALGYALWSFCLSRMSVSRLMPFLYLVAPLSIPLAWAFLGELPSREALIGGGITLAGVVWAGRKQKVSSNSVSSSSVSSSSQ